MHAELHQETTWVVYDFGLVRCRTEKVQYIKILRADTLEREIRLAVVIIHKARGTAEFRSAMGEESLDRPAMVIVGLLSNGHLYYFYGEAWDAISFRLIHHPDDRPDQKENDTCIAL